MSLVLAIRNRQRVRRLDHRLLRRIVLYLLRREFGLEQFELGIHLIAAPAMTELNQRWLRHAGSTDILTFDHTDRAAGDQPLRRTLVRRKVQIAETPSDSPSATPSCRRDAGFVRVEKTRPALDGEMFISLEDAVRQARTFRTTWQRELVRYLVHGVLHLRGHDDRAPAARAAMKRAENGLVRRLARRFPLSQLGASADLSR